MGWFKKLFTDDANECRVYAEPDTVHEEIAPDPVKERATRRTFSDIYPDDSTILVLTEHNPKRRGTTVWEQYELYREVKTVGQARACGIPYKMIDMDYMKGYIDVIRECDAA